VGCGWGSLEVAEEALGLGGGAARGV